MSKYPLDNNVLQEEYEALLIKLALKEYAAEQSEKLMRESNEQLSTQPKQKDHVIAAAFRQATWEDMRSRITHGIGKAVSRVAVVFLAAALSFTTAFAVSPEVRETIYRLIMNTTDRYTEVSLASDPSNQFIDPELYTLEHCYAPTWLPDGYEVKSCSSDVWGVFVVYQNGSYNLSFDQFPSDTNLTLQTDSENALETKTIFINDSEALINTKEYSTATYTTIIWQSGNMLFRVITNDAKEVAIQFAQSIKVLR